MFLECALEVVVKNCLCYSVGPMNVSPAGHLSQVKEELSPGQQPQNLGHQMSAQAPLSELSATQSTAREGTKTALSQFSGEVHSRPLDVIN